MGLVPSSLVTPRLSATALAVLVTLSTALLAPTGATAQGYPTLQSIVPGKPRPVAYLAVGVPGRRALRTSAVTRIARRVADRFRAESQGRLLLRGSRNRAVGGDVLPAVRLARTTNVCDDLSVIDDAVSRVGSDLSRYRNVIVVFPSSPPCSWAGRAGRPGTFVVAAPDVDVIVHELGHNFALDHARSRVCATRAGRPAPLLAACGGSEYGDQFDVMGSTRGGFSGWGRIAVGLLPRNRAVVARRTGRFTIATPDARSGPVVIRVPRAGKQPPGEVSLCLERVPPSLRDPAVIRDGVLVRLCGAFPKPEAYPPFDLPGTELLDLHPGEYGQEALGLGEQFRDRAGAVRLRVDGLSADEAVVAIAVRGSALPEPLAPPPSQPSLTVETHTIDYTNFEGDPPLIARDVAARLSWSTPPGGPPAIAYRISRDNLMVAEIGGELTSWDDPLPIGPRSRVSYSVTAVGDGGSTAAAAPLEVVAVDLPGQPPPPSGLSVRVRKRVVTLRWAAFVPEVPALRQWDVEVDGVPGWWVAADRRSMTGPQIGASGAIRLRVRAVGTDGTPGPWSDPIVARAAPRIEGVIGP